MESDKLKVEIKDVQKVQLEILLEFDRICKKNNIKYQLFAGTLLGAIRHNGFIPWDDDIDVCLLRKDYNKFIKSCKVDLNSKYFLQTYDTDKNYIMQFAKIRKNNTVFLERVTSDCDIHHGVYIDVFPLDKVLPNTLIGKIQQKSLYIIGRLNLTRIKTLCKNTDNNIDKMFRLISHYIMKLVPKKITNLLQIRICSLFENKETKYVSHLTNGASKERLFKYMTYSESFYNTIYGNFEGYFFPIPQMYDEVLSQLFGNYMELPPVENRKPHHGIIDIIMGEDKEKK